MPAQGWVGILSNPRMGANMARILVTLPIDRAVFRRSSWAWPLVWAAVAGACSSPPPEVVGSSCGNGKLEHGEVCDDGNLDDRDDCLSSCKLATCGDGIPNLGGKQPEQCDDGNAKQDDACSNSCIKPKCGDGKLYPALEACDDGNSDDTDACTAQCKPTSCGDGLVQSGEQCDDGNAAANDACLPTCVKATCGDGVVQVGAEECDDGNSSDSDACLKNCVLPKCGDAVVRDGVEACDDGNSVNDDGCSNACALPSCGDGIVHKGEQCDDGNQDNQDACLNSCITALCGDGVLHQGKEACDDGNLADSDACRSACQPAKCGDGVVWVGQESCDDGNSLDTDGCNNLCKLAKCGDGAVQAGEACDDGNASDSDGCTQLCQAAICGDGKVQSGTEACDDGNQDTSDECQPGCKLSACGDGQVLAGVEGCDDGNQNNGDACKNDCSLPSCGDGVVQAGEQCDDGNLNNKDACLSTCQKALCGDGFVQVSGGATEACDDGNQNQTDACSASCQANVCGDGLLWVGMEDCDDGNGKDGDGCSNLCQLPDCGDGTVQAGEQCDDGNQNNQDGCLATCQKASCGDGFVQLSGGATESCDDANQDDHDACTSACKTAGCGDGVIWKGKEVCDDGNSSNADACTTKCSLPSCGDGVLQAGETCDDGNLSNQDGCLSTCQKPSCGDGFVQLSGGATEACDDGNASDGDGCTSACKANVCGDGKVNGGVEACDDGNSIATDGCDNSCTLPNCGDGVLQYGEQCDDGNSLNSDGCLATCFAATCGDGHLQAGVESCDDGNAQSGDGCGPACLPENCGNGVVDPGELCDDGNGDTSDGCLPTCLPASCGDGFVQKGEQCDDGNLVANDACTPLCKGNTCGDGLLWVGAEACDDGNQVNQDACKADCSLNICGDGVVNPAKEVCDDGNGDNSDGCLIDCKTLNLCGQVITKVAPAVVCQGAVPTHLVITGQNFLQYGGKQGYVKINGVQSASVAYSNCTSIAYGEALSCSELKVAVPSLPGAGVYAVEVFNPGGKTCKAESTFSVTPPPTVTGVKPGATCEGTVTLTVTGDNFAPGVQVLLGSKPAESVVVGGKTSLEASWSNVPFGTYSVSVSAGPGCGSTLNDAVQLGKKPIPFFADPPVIWQPLSLPTLLHGSGWGTGATLLAPKPTAVGVRLQGSTQALKSLIFTFDPQKPQTLQVEWPASMAEGTYEAVVSDSFGCAVVLADAYLVSKDASLALDGLDPPFLKQGTGVAAQLKPKAGTLLQPGTAVYFRSGNGAKVVRARAVGVQADGTASLLVPGDLELGKWDVIAVQPNGKVGVIQAGLTILAAAPPSIETIAPGSVPSSGNVPFKVMGSGFGSGAKLELACVAADGQASSIPLSATVQAAEITATLPAISAGSACLVRVTNADGSWDEFAALGVTSPSENLSNFTPSTAALVQARMNHATVAVQAGRNSRFVYAIGGDGGAGLLSSVEVSRVSSTGAAGAFRTVQAALPAPWGRGAAVAVGRSIYVLGGRTGNGTGTLVPTVWRSNVLDPEQAPQVSAAAIEVVSGSGLAEGLWSYRVAAVLGAEGPGLAKGETLPSEPVTIRVPKGLKFKITLSWPTLPAATGYLVYRSAKAGDPSGAEQLIASVTSASVTDQGGQTSAKVAQQLGDLAEFTVVPYAYPAVEENAAVAARDPATPGLWHIYAMGGVNGNTLATAVHTYSVALNGASMGSECANCFGTSFALAKGRAGAVAYRVDQTVTPRLDAAQDSWIYLLSGRGASGAGVTALSMAKVKAGGGLVAPWIDDNKSANGRWGYGGVAIANQVFVFGGDQGAASTSGLSGQLCGPGNKNCAAAPGIQNLNAGISLATARAWFGLVTLAGRIFAVGGQDSSGKPLATVESTLW